MTKSPTASITRCKCHLVTHATQYFYSPNTCNYFPYPALQCMKCLFSVFASIKKIEQKVQWPQGTHLIAIQICNGTLSIKAIGKGSKPRFFLLGDLGFLKESNRIESGTPKKSTQNGIFDGPDGWKWWILWNWKSSANQNAWEIETENVNKQVKTCWSGDPAKF